MKREMQARLESLPKTEASFIVPMECLSVSKLPEGSNWLWEVKLDGYRALGVKSGAGVKTYGQPRCRKTSGAHAPSKPLPECDHLRRSARNLRKHLPAACP